MSETDSDSTDSDNNNLSLFYNHYLRLPQEPEDQQDGILQMINSSDSEDSPSGYFDSSPSDMDVRF